MLNVNVVIYDEGINERFVCDNLVEVKEKVEGLMKGVKIFFGCDLIENVIEIVDGELLMGKVNSDFVWYDEYCDGNIVEDGRMCIGDVG